MDRSQSLAVLPSLPVQVTRSGGFVLTGKFVEGMKKYADHWDGPITAFMEPSATPSTNLDETAVDPASLPFHLEVVSFADPDLGRKIAGHGVALCSVGFQQGHMGKLCREVGVPSVYVAEYSLKTRFQVVRASGVNPVVALRRMLWESQQEARNRKAIRLASAVQCNGTPVYEAYRSINPRPLLYFDTRVTEDLVVGREELDRRLETLKQGGPLRLIFSGRFVPMKGADDLVRVAEALRRLGVPFEMTLCGDGELTPGMRERVDRLGLGDLVRFAGNLDFTSELLPFTKREADLFVCCHRTGDPSCTYLEVMSCGVPIVGYDNEAFRGVVRESGCGWTVPMNRPGLVAEKIAELHRDRAKLIDASRASADFGRIHTFDRTFKARVDHMKSCLGPASHRAVGT